MKAQRIYMFDFSLAYTSLYEVADRDYDTMVKFTVVKFGIAKEVSTESPLFCRQFQYCKRSVQAHFGTGLFTINRMFLHGFHPDEEVSQMAQAIIQRLKVAIHMAHKVI